MKIIRPILIILTALLGLTIFNLHASTFGVFSKSVLNEFGWSRTTVSGAFSLSLLASLPFLLVAGIVFDWRGGRLVIIAGTLITALASYGLYRVSSSGQFIVWYCAFAAGGALFGGIVPVVVLANWFVRLRGILIGLVVALASVGTITPPTGFLVNSFGWRTSYLVLGLLPLLIIPLALFIKRRPEDAGSAPDFGMVSDRGTLLGQWSPLAASRYHPSYDAQGLVAGLKAYPLSFGKNKGTALGTLAAILFLVIAVLAYAAKGGIAPFLVLAMVDAGARTSAAALSLTALSIAVPAGALVLGVLSDFLHARFCLAASLLIFGAGILMFSANPLSPVAPPLMGFGQGGLVCLVTIVLADYFGRGALGSLRGFVALLAIVASGAAPVLLGYLYDTIGSLSPSFIGIGVAVLVGAMLALFMRPPHHEALLVVDDYSSKPNIRASQGERMTESEPGKKSRHGCLTAYLILVIIGNSAVALLYLLGTDLLKRAYPSAPPWLFVTMAVLDVLNLVFAIALLRWKKWGFWGFCGTSVTALVLNLILGLGIWVILSSIIAIVIMYAILQIGKDNKGWPQLE